MHSLRHFEIVLPQAVQCLHKPVLQFLQPLSPATTEFGVSAQGPGELLKGSGGHLWAELSGG